MRSRRGAAAIGAMLLLAALTGCATSVGGVAKSSAVPVPTSTAAAEPAAAPSPSPAVTLSAEDAEAQQRAENWLETTPVPPQAVRVEASPSGIFAGQWQSWICSPTKTVTAYWTVDSMSPGEALNWMIAHPTPGLVLTRTEPVADDGDYDAVSMGATPEGESLQGIAFTYVRMPKGSAIRAEIGATPTTAVCPDPPEGGVWGGPGEG
ncbi:hypothetical protein [Microbacterium sp. NPDC057650]|uniref:hypothetical protein n=1 Tax=unclassified Microbacterium TaxID=2609290 RepID=UPI00366C3903